MKFFGALLLPFNREFMTGYVTTLKWTVYFPSEKSIQNNPENAVETLMHEFIHLWDRKQKGVWFSVEYLSPQIWAIVPFAGLAVFGWLFPLWTDCLIFGLGMLYAWLLGHPPGALDSSSGVIPLHYPINSGRMGSWQAPKAWNGLSSSLPVGITIKCGRFRIVLRIESIRLLNRSEQINSEYLLPM